MRTFQNVWGQWYKKKKWYGSGRKEDRQQNFVLATSMRSNPLKTHELSLAKKIYRISPFRTMTRSTETLVQQWVTEPTWTLGTWTLDEWFWQQLFGFNCALEGYTHAPTEYSRKTFQIFFEMMLQKVRNRSREIPTCLKLTKDYSTAPEVFGQRPRLTEYSITPRVPNSYKIKI